MNDIRINDTSDPEWYKTSEPKEWFYETRQYRSFRGHFNGNGHVISGIYINRYLDTTATNATFGGLFPAVGKGAVIEKLGIENSYISAKHAAGICGYIDYHDRSDVSGIPIGYPLDADLPYFTQCFASSDVIVEGGASSGGIIGGTPSSVRLDNCYSVATIIGRVHGGLIGYSWNDTTLYISNCFAYANELVSLASKNPCVGENNYASVLDGFGVTQLVRSRMIGDAAKLNTGLDFDNIWQTVPGRTPTLRVFGPDQPDTHSLENVTVKINFVSGFPDMVIDPAEGFAGDPIPWPEMKRRGFTFEGWYVYPSFDVKFDIDVFPDGGPELNVYAKWIGSSINQSFEGYPYRIEGVEGLGKDHELIGLGIGNSYNPKYIHGDLRALHRIGNDAGYQSFSIFDDTMDRLIRGQKYEISFWIYVENASSGGKIRLVHADDTDVNGSQMIGYESVCDIGSLKKGEWCEVFYTFTANGETLWIASPGLCSIYFDDFMIVPVGETGVVGKLEWMNKDYTPKGSGKGTVIGRLLDENGYAISDVTVVLYSDVMETKTNFEGVFGFWDVPVGKHSIGIWYNGEEVMADDEVVVKADSTTILELKYDGLSLHILSVSTNPDTGDAASAWAIVVLIAAMAVCTLTLRKWKRKQCCIISE